MERLLYIYMYFLDGSKGNSNIKKSREILSYDLNARNSRNWCIPPQSNPSKQWPPGFSRCWKKNIYIYIDILSNKYIYICRYLFLDVYKYERCFWHVYYGDAYYHTFWKGIHSFAFLLSVVREYTQRFANINDFYIHPSRPSRKPLKDQSRNYGIHRDERHQELQGFQPRFPLILAFFFQTWWSGFEATNVKKTC